MTRISHNHGPANGPGLDCTEHPVGACLVVIDPEDREQVERLAERIGHLWKSHTYVRDVVQAALREFANPTPPKPEEPTGLGAVVETVRGELFVRDKTTTTVAHWKRARGGESGKRHRYDNIDAVRVLSEGVTP